MTNKIKQKLKITKYKVQDFRRTPAKCYFQQTLFHVFSGGNVKHFCNSRLMCLGKIAAWLKKPHKSVLCKSYLSCFLHTSMCLSYIGPFMCLVTSYYQMDQNVACGLNDTTMLGNVVIYVKMHEDCCFQCSCLFHICMNFHSFKVSIWVFP